MMRRKWIALGLVAAVLSVIGCLVGCAQNTEATSPQRVQQNQDTTPSTDQSLLTSGSDVKVKVYIINAPGNDSLPGDYQGTDGELIASASGSTATAGKVSAGYAQAGITVNIPITTGGTTPSNTGSAVATADQPQTANQHQENKPVQDIKPETTAAAPLTVGLPGSATSGTANVAGSGGQMGSPVSSPTQTPTYTDFRVPTAIAPKALEILQDLIASELNKAASKPS